MEISLGVFDRKTRKLRFAGAKGKITIINKSGVEIIKGDNYPIGGWQIESNRVYHEHEMTLAEDTIIYMSSDGMKDQFGGEKNKKLMDKKLLEYLVDMHDLPLTIQKTFLSMAFNEWKGDKEQTDDVCMLALRL